MTKQSKEEFKSSESSTKHETPSMKNKKHYLDKLGNEDRKREESKWAHPLPVNDSTKSKTNGQRPTFTEKGVNL
jgi:hypothetical protein